MSGRRRILLLALAGFALAVCWTTPAQAEDAPAQTAGEPQTQPTAVPERRKDPFPSEESYLILPLPYSLPGIGSGLFLTAYETNYVFPHRAYALLIQGDAEGTIFGLEQVQLMPKRLLFDVFWQDINHASYRNYALRGMDTGKNDYSLLELSKVQDTQWQFTFTSWERRLEAFVNGLQEEVRVTRVRDPSGNAIADFAQPLKSTYQQYVAGLRLDLTDEYYDPRKGVRLVTEYTDTPRQDPDQPDFYVVTTRLAAYVPVGHQSTIAFTALQSDARVRSTGDTDLASLNRKNSLGCAPADLVCRGSQAALVANDLAANSHGTAQTLGGQNYLRAYPGSRFRGAHTLYYSVELRANLTDEFTPFDYVFFKDIRTGVQVAPFYEAGSVSETEGALGAKWRTDYGVGLRVVTASGTVYRVDVADSDEGSNVTIIVNYPW